MAGAAPTPSRYDSIVRLAAGGMATVWVGTVRGALGFRQLVAIKKPHPHLLEDPQFRAELLAEARLASMIHHANVVDVRDVEVDGDAMSLVMDYIEGASLGELIVAANKRGEKLPPGVAVRVILDALSGLHAAHELVDERDRPVSLVHRDVSPQNILVGLDGIARVTDFGVAKFARKHMQSTSDGSLKGKLAYMPPEYLRGEAIDRRFDVFATGVVLWEALSGKRLFRGDNEADTLNRVLTYVPPKVSTVAPEVGPALDDVLAHALEKERAHRFQNAAAMGAALEGTARDARLVASHTEVAALLRSLVGEAIDARRALIRSKLANEPSVASLMGGVSPPKDLPPTVSAPSPTTEPDGSLMAPPPPTAIAGRGPQASTLREAPPIAFPTGTVSMTETGRPVTTEPGPVAMNETALPTTQPMTDRMSPAQPVGAPAPSGREVGPTQVSPGLDLHARTQLSDAPPHWQSAPPPQESAPDAFHDPSRAYSAVELSNASAPQPSRRWGVPLAIGISVAALGVAGVILKVRADGAAPPPSSVEPLAPVIATGADPTPTALPSASATASATTSAPPPATAKGARRPAAPAPAPQAPASPATPAPATPAPATPAPATPATSAGPKRPPPDPYKTGGG